MVQVVSSVDVKVEVKDNGQMKKGGKQIIALELYKKFVVDAEEGNKLSNSDFVKLLMKELGMSLAGSRTYAYNCKNHFAK